MVYKLGIISLGSKSSKMLAEEAKQYFEEVVLIDLKKVEIKIENEATALYDGKPLVDFDCLYMRGSYKYASLLYGLTIIYKDKVFTPIEENAHIIGHNKFMTHLFLSSIPSVKMPLTYYAANISETKAFLKTLNYPMILKFPSGTHGKGVIFTQSYLSASSMLDALDVLKQPLIVQDYIDIKSDIRVIVAGDKIVGSMKRIAKKDEIRANAHQGGDAEPFIVTPKIKQISIDVARKLKAGVCAIDLIESNYGPLVLEVNTSPGLQKITEVTKKNIANDIVKYLFEETKKKKSQLEKLKTKDLMSNLGISEISSRDFEGELIVKNGKIIIPEFAYKMVEFQEGLEVTYRISKNKIEIFKSSFSSK